MSNKIATKNATLIEENKNLKRENLALKMRTSNTAHFDEDVRAAIKFAMMHSHPDKGGNSKDFIRFHELYEKTKNLH